MELIYTLLFSYLNPVALCMGALFAVVGIGLFALVQLPIQFWLGRKIFGPDFDNSRPWFVKASLISVAMCPPAIVILGLIFLPTWDLVTPVLGGSDTRQAVLDALQNTVLGILPPLVLAVCNYRLGCKFAGIGVAEALPSQEAQKARIWEWAKFSAVPLAAVCLGTAQWTIAKPLLTAISNFWQ